MSVPIYIGWDASEMMAWNVAYKSMQITGPGVIGDVRRLALTELQSKGLYTRPTEHRDGRLWDVISESPMSTGHANGRFFVPMLEGFEGWALFVDGDILVRRDIRELLALRDDKYAVMCVQHDYSPQAIEKKAGHVQTNYSRKNWSSVMLFNCGHWANRVLPQIVNTLPGRDLHRFCWLRDEYVGALPADWNWLVGHSSPEIDPAIVHFTEGLPDRPGYEHVPFAEDWYAMARKAKYRDAYQPVKVA